MPNKSEHKNSIAFSQNLVYNNDTEEMGASFEASDEDADKKESVPVVEQSRQPVFEDLSKSNNFSQHYTMPAYNQY